MESRTYELRSEEDGLKAILTVTAPVIIGAEQNLVVMDDKAQPVVVIELQPGIDRREVKA